MDVLMVFCNNITVDLHGKSMERIGMSTLGSKDLVGDGGNLSLPVKERDSHTQETTSSCDFRSAPQ